MMEGYLVLLFKVSMLSHKSVPQVQRIQKIKANNLKTLHLLDLQCPLSYHSGLQWSNKLIFKMGNQWFRIGEKS